MHFRFFFTLFVIAALFLISTHGCIAAGGQESFEIVESVPVETTLDVPEVRHTDEVWLEMINGARKTIDIEQFYFATNKGEPMDKVLDALEKAADRGVAIRIITEENFRSQTISSCERLSKRKNISWKWISIFKDLGGIQHAKYFVVDGKNVYIGSANFDWRSLKHINEMGVHVRHNECGRMIEDLFELDWKLCDAKNLKEAAPLFGKMHYKVPLRVKDQSGEIIEFTPVFDPAEYLTDNDLWEGKRLFSLIRSARKSLHLQMLTYTPITREKEYWPELDDSLRTAEYKGADIKAVLSDWSMRKPDIFYLKSLAVLPNVHIKLSTIPQWSGGFIPYSRVQHSKYLLIDDDTSWIGSSNWEKGYFYTSRNVGMIINSRKINNLLRKVFFTTWESNYAQPLDLNRDYVMPKRSE
ncbi:MAG: phospholipase D-like domain-containing protein [Candidatus Xenobiia bacterium LiM19]